MRKLFLAVGIFLSCLLFPLQQAAAQSAAAALTAVKTSICTGESVTLTISLSGVAPFSFSYTDGFTTKTVNNITQDQLTNGKYFLTESPTSGRSYRLTSMTANGVSGSILTSGIWINVNSPSGASIYSASTNPSCSGATAVFAIGYSPCSTVTWEISSDNGASYQPLAGNGNYASAALENLGTDVKNYYVRVKQGIPGNQVTSAPFVQQVYPLLKKGTIQATQSIICSGQTVTLTSTGQTGNVTWERNFRGMWSSTGQTGSTYTATLYNSFEPIRFRAAYSFNYPACGILYSDSMDITVQPPMLPSAILATNLVACNNQPFTISLVNYGGGSTQWEQSTDQINYTEIAGATSPTLNTTFSNTTEAPTTVYLRIRSSQLGCATVYSNVVPCTVNPTPSVGAITPLTQSICAGNTATFSVASVTGNLIKWYKSTDNVNFIDTWASNSTSITTNPLYASGVSTVNYYKAVVSTPGCSGVATSDVAQITIYQNVYPSGYPNEMYTPLDVCTGGSATLKLNAPPIGTIQWVERINGSYIDIPGANGVNYQTPALVNPGNSFETRYYSMYLVNGTCKSYTGGDITVRVHPAVVPGYITTDKNPLCKGEQTSIYLKNANSNTIKWYMSSDGGATYADAYQDVKTSFLTFPVFPTTQPYLERVYKASVANAGCAPVFTDSFTLRTVNISPGIYLNHPYPQSISLCEKTNGELININTASPIYGNYSWQVSTSSATSSFSDIPGTTNVASFALPAYTNTGATEQVFYYRAKLTNGTACAPVYSTVYTVTISPKPGIGTLSVSADKICSEQSVRLDLTSANGAIYWYAKDPNSTYAMNVTMPPTLSATRAMNIGSFNSNSVDYEFYAESNTPGCAAVRSNSVHTIVYQPAFHNYSQIQLNTCNVITSGNTATLRINGTPIGDRYDWLIQYPGTTNYVLYKSTVVPQLTTDPLLNVDGNSLNYNFKAVVYSGPCTASSPINGIVGIKVLPDAAHTELTAPSNVCGATSFPLTIKDYGQSSLTLYKILANGNLNIVTVTFTKNAGVFTTTVPITASTNFTLISFYPSNCGGGFGKSFTVNTFGVAPAAPVSVDGAASACQGTNPLTFIVPLQSSALSYEWQVTPASAGVITTNGNSAVLTPAANFAGTFTIGCRAVNTCGASAYTSKSVVVNPTPDVHFINLPSGVCLSSNPASAVVLATNVTGVAFNGDTDISNGSFYPVTVGSHTITYNYTEPTTSCTVSGSQVVEVFPLPVVSAGADTAVCLGNSITLAGAGALTYVWDKNVVDGAAFAPQSSDTYTVEGTSAEGCKSIDDVVVTVNTTVAPVAIVGSDKACHGDVSLPYSVAVQSGVLGYEWQIDPASAGTITANDYAASLSLDPSFVGNLSIQCRTINGCGASSYTSKVITVNSLPNVQFTNLPANVCLSTNPADGILLTTNVTGAIINGDPDISNGKFYPVTVGQHAPAYTYTDPTTGCTSTGAQLIEVHPLPVVNAGGDVEVCKGGSVTLQASGALGYTWSNNVINNVPFIPATTTTYTVTGNSAEGCAAADDVLVTVHNLPQPQIIGLNAGYCLNASVDTLSSNLSGGIFSGPGISGNLFTPSSQGNKVITYTYTDVHGCTGLGSATTTVQGSISQPFLCAQNQGWCSPSTIQVCIFDMDPRTAQLKWYNNNLAPISGVVGTTLPYTSASTNYYVSSVTQYGCESGKTIVPVHIGTPAINPIQTCSGVIDLATFVQSPVYPESVRFFADSRGKTPLNANAYNATVSTTIYTTVQMVDLYGSTCNSALAPVTITVLGCSLKSSSFFEEEASIGVNVYPVPATAEVSVNGLPKGNYRAEVFNSKGESLSVSEVSSNGEAITMDIQNLSEGIYHFVFSNDSERHVLRVVKE